MTTNPIYTFEDLNSKGINKIPNQSLVLIENSDGNHNTKYIIKISNSGLDDNSTINDFLNTPGLWQYTMNTVDAGVF